MTHSFHQHGCPVPFVGRCTIYQGKRRWYKWGQPPFLGQNLDRALVCCVSWDRGKENGQIIRSSRTNQIEQVDWDEHVCGGPNYKRRIYARRWHCIHNCLSIVLFHLKLRKESYRGRQATRSTIIQASPAEARRRWRLARSALVGRCSEHHALQQAGNSRLSYTKVPCSSCVLESFSLASGIRCPRIMTLPISAS
jgi:hypothetical protein